MITGVFFCEFGIEFIARFVNIFFKNSYFDQIFLVFKSGGIEMVYFPMLDLEKGSGEQWVVFRTICK